MVDLLVDAIDQDVLPPEADTVVRALSRSVSEHVALDDVVVRAAAGVNVERALAVRNFAKHDNSPISGHRQRTKNNKAAKRPHGSPFYSIDCASGDFRCTTGAFYVTPLSPFQAFTLQGRR